jgi:glutathione synthase/RimK-type ligase-like ATP-grasp enzyme
MSDDDKQPSGPKYILVSDRPMNFLPADADMIFMRATDFIAGQGDIDFRKSAHLKVINLCSNFDYLSKGYYCSLLAEARAMRCVPSIDNVVLLNWKRHYQSHLPELNALLQKNYKETSDEPSARTYSIFFGRCSDEGLEPLARRLFDLFRFPLMSVEVKLDAKGKWVVSNVEPLSISDLSPQKQESFVAALTRFTGTAWRKAGAKKNKHWLAVLQDPDEKSPPSNKGALERIVKAGKDAGVSVELITKADFSTLLEYDALFIRETTAINHHTYRFAHKADAENIPCIDDAASIIRCCNKVFQYELLKSKRIPLPETYIIGRKTEKSMEQEFEYPLVVKIPDGAFSRGMIKAFTPDEFHHAVNDLLKKSDIVLAQEFIESDFDWRVTFLAGEPLFACQYFMAPGHWQIYNHSAKTIKGREGKHQPARIDDVPHDVMVIAKKAAGLIGNGLYGVDLKLCGDRVVVMEVNDNPTIDHGLEDAIVGDALYRRIIDHFVQMIEA